MFNIVYTVVRGLLNLLPDITWSVDTGAVAYFIDICRVVSYLLPMDTIGRIIGLIFIIILFRLVISIIKTIWELLPVL